MYMCHSLYLLVTIQSFVVQLLQERMSLISPSVYHSQCSLRCISVTSDDSSAEVFENDADNLPCFSGSLKGSKLNAEV